MIVFIIQNRDEESDFDFVKGDQWCYFKNLNNIK